MAEFDVTPEWSNDLGSIGWSQRFTGTDLFGNVVDDQADIASFMTVRGVYVTYDDEYRAFLNLVTDGPVTSPKKYASALTSGALVFTPPGETDELTLTLADASVTYLAYDDNFDSTDPFDARLVWTWEVSELPAVFELYSDTVFTLTATAGRDTSFNCECDDVNNNETLAELRERLMVRLGYAAQLENPPPGMTVLLNDFLVSAQRTLYRRFEALRTERFFNWALTTGIRYYDLPDNLDSCTKRLDTLKITDVYIEDVNGVWVPLAKGISPSLYTGSTFYGMPWRYEIRQCIEVFPAPDTRYILHVKGQFGLSALSADDDQTTIDSELVFLWALGNAKAHYGQPDANEIKAEANTYRLDLISGKHQTRRYIPGTVPLPSVPRPVFLPLQGGES